MCVRITVILYIAGSLEYSESTVKMSGKMMEHLTKPLYVKLIMRSLTVMQCKLEEVGKVIIDFPNIFLFWKCALDTAEQCRPVMLVV